MKVLDKVVYRVTLDFTLGNLNYNDGGSVMDILHEYIPVIINDGHSDIVDITIIDYNQMYDLSIYKEEGENDETRENTTPDSNQGQSATNPKCSGDS